MLCNHLINEDQCWILWNLHKLPYLMQVSLVLQVSVSLLNDEQGGLSCWFFKPPHTKYTEIATS